MNRNKHKGRSPIPSLVLALFCIGLFAFQQTLAANNQEPSQPISSRLAFWRAQRAAAASKQQTAPRNETTTPPKTSTTEAPTTTVLKNNPTSVQESARSNQTPAATVTKAINLQQANRTTRTADVFQNGDGFNIFVTNTCERELMHVNIKTSRPFFGVIHTRNQRQKPICTVEGNGETDYNLDISHVLNQQEPAYCGVIKARKESPEDKDLLSVVLAVRVHRNIELSDDKFFLLNCTNRCRRPDCSGPPARLTNENETSGRVIGDDLTGTEREGEPGEGPKRTGVREEDECTVWKFPWLITLLWCMGIMLLAMMISHCIMCSSLVCRCVKTEVEEREPSVYEGATDLDDEDSLYNRKTHPMRIDYDNKDIYKTGNNYEPYTLKDVDCNEDDLKKANKRRNKSSR